MEWIEVTGKTIEEAQEHALKMLGVERSEAEFLVLEEPKSGIFSIKKSTARIRARIKPREVQPRRRNQSKRRGSNKQSSSKPQNRKKQPERERGQKEQKERGRNENNFVELPLMPQNEQEQILNDFFYGLLDAWNLSAEIGFEWPRENICEIRLNGPNLEVLIGYNAETLSSLEEIARISLKKKTNNNRYAQIRLDINDYRLKRQEALVNFVRKLAEEVQEFGKPKILEPMNNRDRKVIHDALNDVDGVTTLSEGENPNRRVKILPERAS